MSFFRENKTLILISLLIFAVAFPVNAKSLIIATGEWSPFTSTSMENYGKFTERVTIICKEIGIEPEYRFYPWGRCYDSVIKGRVWAAFPYSYTKERAKKVWFSDMLSCSSTLFFHYDHGNPSRQYHFKSMEDLKAYTLGGVRGYFYEEFFEKAGLKVDYVNKEINSLEKLKMGRIDLMPVNEQVGWNLIAIHFPEDLHKFKTLATPLSVNSLHLIISKDYPGSKKIFEQFNQALKRCVEKGLINIQKCDSNLGLIK